ncbi:MAG: PadR family transcriptional regulator [Acidobacteria bacterium]|nr:PadR family transcriptional regulator [Acidobacteriota bacterium]
MGERNLLGAFEELVLLAVARGDGDAYGMSVRRDVQARSGRDVTIGAVYSTLDRLETKGLLGSVTREGDAVRGGQARRCFELAPEGATALLEARERHDSAWRDLDREQLADVAGGD